MDGIVTLLDNDHYHYVEDLWAELEREFSVDGVYITPYPHFSYHVAQDYDVDKVEPVLKRITSYITTFKVRTSGLGIFTGASPVLYIPVVRSLELTQLHQELWQEISTVSSGAQGYYDPDQWMPHITIGFGDISQENLSQIIPFLAKRDFDWEISVNNLAFIHDSGTKQEMKARFDITNEPIPGELSMRRLHRRTVTRETLEHIHKVHKEILQDRQGKSFEDLTEMIRQMREERTRQLMGEDEDLQ
jgi:2'-5' RNA ligase